jgi:NADH-quinone oxidoreductase subunit L
MTIGTLAITGVGIIQVAGLPSLGFAGFFSKDAIIESAFASSSAFGGVAFAIGVFAALLTSFYSWRLVFLTFFGKARWAAVRAYPARAHGEHEDPGDESSITRRKPHRRGAPSQPAPAAIIRTKSPWTMLVPLALLSIGAVAAGFVYHEAFIGAEEGVHFWAGSIAFDPHLSHAMHEVPLWVKLSASAAMLTGLAIAWLAYIRDPSIPGTLRRPVPAAPRLPLQQVVFRRALRPDLRPAAVWLGRLLWKGGDEGQRSTASAPTARSGGVRRHPPRPRGSRPAMSIPMRW